MATRWLMMVIKMEKVGRRKRLEAGARRPSPQGREKYKGTWGGSSEKRKIRYRS